MIQLIYYKEVKLQDISISKWKQLYNEIIQVLSIHTVCCELRFNSIIWTKSYLPDNFKDNLVKYLFWILQNYTTHRNMESCKLIWDFLTLCFCTGMAYFEPTRSARVLRSDSYMKTSHHIIHTSMYVYRTL